MNRVLRIKGMTLVELLIALAIFMIVIVTVGAFEVNVFSYQGSVSGSFTTAQDAQILLKTILTELRSAAPGANGAYPIITAGTSSLSFFSDPDNDGLTEEITYSYIQNTLYRAVIVPTGTPYSYSTSNQSTSSLLTNVANTASTSIFEYYDQNYTGTSSPLSVPVNIPSIRLIQINLTLDTNQSKLPARTYTTQVSLRNLKTNL